MTRNHDSNRISTIREANSSHSPGARDLLGYLSVRYGGAARDPAEFSPDTLLKRRASRFGRNVVDSLYLTSKVASYYVAQAMRIVSRFKLESSLSVMQAE